MSEVARPILPTLARPLLLIAGLSAAGWALRSLHLHDLAGQAKSLGLVSFVALGAAACAVALPRQLVAFAGGYAHGIWLGGLLALAAQLLGCTADLLWARHVMRDFVHRRLRVRFGTRLAAMDRFLTGHPFRATLTLRLLPIGNSAVLSLLAGSLGVDPAAFLAGSAVGYLPQTVVFVLLGSGVQLGRYVQVGVALAAFAGSAVLGWVLLRRGMVAQIE